MHKEMHKRNPRNIRKKKIPAPHLYVVDEMHMSSIVLQYQYSTLTVILNLTQIKQIWFSLHGTNILGV